MKRKELPRSVKIYVQQCGGVIVGGAAIAGAKAEAVADIDVIIPWSRWQRAAVIAALYVPGLNSYGGFRYADSGKTIDVWPGELSEFMLNGNVKYLWFPQQNNNWTRNDVD